MKVNVGRLCFLPLLPLFGVLYVVCVCIICVVFKQLVLLMCIPLVCVSFLVLFKMFLFYFIFNQGYGKNNMEERRKNHHEI